MIRFEILARTLAEHPILERLAFASLELALLVILFAALLRVSRLRAPRLISLLWMIVLAKPLVTLSIGAPIELAVLEAPGVAVTLDTPAAADGFGGLASTSPSGLLSGGGYHDLRSSQEVGSPPSGDAISALLARSVDCVPWILGLWLAGTGFFLIRHLRLRRRFARLVAESQLAPPPLRHAAAGLACELGLADSPELRITRELESPALVGVLRPVVLLPEWLARRGWCNATSWAVRHELLHYRWRDPWAILLRDLVLGLFHFHPLAWWAGQRHLLALEQACDRDTIGDASQGRAYAEGLLEIAAEVRRRARVPQIAVLGAVGHGRLTERVAAMLDAERVRPLSRAAAAAAVLVASAVFAVGGGVATAQDPDHSHDHHGAQGHHGHDGGQGEHAHEAHPSHFFLGPLTGDEFLAICKGTGASSSGYWGRPHTPEVYERLFTDPSNPFDRKSGDVLVLLLANDDEQRVPGAYADLLPAPWSEIETRLARGEQVELSGNARSVRVLVLATPTRAQLAEFAQPRIAAFCTAPSQSHKSRWKDVFLVGPADFSLFEQLVASTSRGTGSKTGRPHDPGFYRELFEDPANRHDRSDGDLLVMLVTTDEDGGRPPEGFEDLLLRPWAEIEATLRAGEKVEIAGWSRGLEVVVLGARDTAGLSELARETKLLHRYRPAGADETAPLPGLPAGTRYVVTFDADDRRVATVRLEIPAAEGTLALQMGGGAHHLEDGYLHFLRRLTAVDAAGVNLPVERADGNTVVFALRGEPVVLEYAMELGHDARPWPEGGPDEGPYATDDDVFWTGRALFLAASHAGVEVEFHLPAGWTVSTPWAPAADKTDTYRVGDERELRESFLLAGTHEQLLAECEGTMVVLAVGRGMGASAVRLRDTVQRILESGRALFGGVPAGRELLVANVGPFAGLNGGVFGRSISLLADRPFDVDQAADWAPFVAHEVLHLWNGGAMRPSGRGAWFSEGFTEYYAHVLCARLGLIDRAQFKDRVESAARAYLAVAGTTSIREAGAPDHELRAMQYDGGFLTALLLDLRLRRITHSAHDLDEMMQELFRRHGTGGRGYGLEDISAVAGDLAGGDLDRFFARYVAGREILPLQEELAAAGLHLEVVEQGASIELSYAVHEMLGIRSVTQTEAGLLVRRTTDTPFEEDDLLTAIDGRRVSSFQDLQETLAEKRAGESVLLTVVRHGESTDLSLVVGGRADAPLERQIQVRLSASAGGEASVFADLLRPRASH